MFKKLISRISGALGHGPDAFLKNVRGVIHVGANVGQERDLYRRHGLRVLWIEPIPEVYEQLKVNIAGYKRQVAYCYLVTNENGRTYNFHVANNGGASSSILDFKDHKEVWPEVEYERSIPLESVTLPKMLEVEGLGIQDYDALILDTQGSEMLVLEGARAVLGHFQYVKVEAPDFESYEGCCLLGDLEAFMEREGFGVASKVPFATHAKGGQYYDVIFQRK